jgi:hypothetical protein
MAEGEGRFEWDEKRRHLEFVYPNIYPDAPLDRVSIGLTHVRAANTITVEYDGERDGWVIRMDRTVERDGCAETVAEACEVAFVPAWNETEADEP